MLQPSSLIRSLPDVSSPWNLCALLPSHHRTDADGSAPWGLGLPSRLPEASAKMEAQLTCKINTRLPGSDKD